MFLKKLELKNFRNIDNVNFEFKKNINIFIGNNAQGKTNVLESIYFLSITKSHRTSNDQNLIKKNELFTKVSGSYVNELNNEFILSILFNLDGKKVSINNVVQKKISNYLSRFNVIMFCPDDIEIIKGSPSVRRKFLNIELSQLKNEYVLLLKEYNNILKQRNEYLKQKTNSFNRMYFDILTDKFIDINLKISEYRYKFIEKLNIYIKDIFKFIFESGNLSIKYNSFIKENELFSKDSNVILKEKFNNIFSNEINQKITLYGIHKDDFKLYLNDLSVDQFCSQGQQRLAILCLKLSEIAIFTQEKKIKPIILLDDIFSELDEQKKNNIIKYFGDDMQIFITTTDINDINSDLRNKSDIYIVDDATFIKED